MEPKFPCVLPAVKIIHEEQIGSEPRCQGNRLAFTSVELRETRLNVRGCLSNLYP